MNNQVKLIESSCDLIRSGREFHSLIVEGKLLEYNYNREYIRYLQCVTILFVLGIRSLPVNYIQQFAGFCPIQQR